MRAYLCPHSNYYSVLLFPEPQFLLFQRGKWHLKPHGALEPSRAIRNQCLVFLSDSEWQRTKELMAFYIIIGSLKLPIKAKIVRAEIFKTFLWFDLESPES